MRWFSLLLRGLWFRRGLTAAVLVVAVVTTATAALGPLYARAAAESTLQDALAAHGSTTGLHFQTSIDASNPANYDQAAAQVPSAASLTAFQQPIGGLYAATGAQVIVTSGPAAPVNTHLLWRAGQCDHLVIVHGRCPQAAGEALISQRTTETVDYGWALGRRLSLSDARTGTQGADGAATSTPAIVTVVGTYRPRDSAEAYWFGRTYFDARLGGGTSQGREDPDTVDTVFVSRAEFSTLAAPANTELDLDYPLRPSAVRLATAARLSAQVTRLRAQYTAQAPLILTTGLPQVLTDERAARGLLQAGTLLVTLQLGLLAWLVLFQVVADAIEARGNEIALSKLRGRSLRATMAFGLGEPLFLLAAAIPLGLGLAALVTYGFAHSLLVAGVPVIVPGASVVAAFGAFGGGVLAALLAAHRTLTRSVLDQWQQASSGAGRSRAALAVDLVLSALAIGGLLLLHGHSARPGHQQTSAALLAPGLLVFAVALLGIRLLPLGARFMVARSRTSPRIGFFLAWRQMARRPGSLRLAALLAVAVGLATFAVAGESAAGVNRTARARSELGAAQVARIQFHPGNDPVAAVRRADPGGRWAMAAATWSPAGGGSVVSTVLAVDSTRLAAVGYQAVGGPTLSSIADDLGHPAAPTVTITASSLRATITTTDLKGTPPNVQFNFRTSSRSYLNVESSALKAGTHTYTAAIPCQSGCRLRGVTWDRSIFADGEVSGTAVLSRLEQSTGAAYSDVAVDLTTAESWRAATPAGQATDTVSVSERGITDRFTSISGGYGGIGYADAPTIVPVVATPGAVVRSPGVGLPLKMLDTNGAEVAYAEVSDGDLLPAVLNSGVMADVTYLRSFLTTFDDEASWQVWLGPDAPPDALARLSAAGIVVEGVATADQRRTVLGRQGPALSLALLLAIAIAGSVLAVGGTAISLSSSSRRRSFELAALRVVGVRRGSLLRAGVTEQLLLLGSALLLGVPAGLVAALLAMPAIPEFSDATPVQLHYFPQPLPLVAFVGTFAVLLTVTAVVAGYSLLRVAAPARLREAAS
ncbi:hypothetical protein BH10ACT8_BH10ACT8_13720 [soil metagenome]